MVYGRRYTRRYNRRTGVYKRKGYSMYKLYKNRSSGSQARQIYGLNNKLRRIERLTKPEINIAPLVQSVLRSDQGSVFVGGTGVKYFTPIQLTNLISQDADAQAGYARLEGRFARIQNITVKGTFSYLNALDSADVQRQPAYARVLIYQTENTRGDSLQIGEVFTTTTAGTVNDSTDSSGSTLGSYALMRAPLALGLARKVKVISDKLYAISDTRQTYMIKTKLRYVKNWYQAINEDVPKGNVVMRVLLYNTSSGSASTEIIAASECRLDLVSKCVYTDA